MKHKIKALGAGLVAAAAVVALGGGSATATSGGHFVSGSEHTVLKSVSAGQHAHTFNTHSGPITCEPGTFKHEGTFSGTTVTSIDLVPSYGAPGGGGCGTEGGTPITSYTYNGCVYRLTVAAKTTSSTEQTLHFVCPVGKVLEFHQPNCLATMPSQTATGTVTYANVLQNGKHSLTLSLNATFETQYHGGLCVFLGTKQSATLSGSALVNAFNSKGEQVSVTAT
jgi:hypothetical protein